jgi:hypothetical protein
MDVRLLVTKSNASAESINAGLFSEREERYDAVEPRGLAALKKRLQPG